MSVHNFSVCIIGANKLELCSAYIKVLINHQEFTTQVIQKEENPKWKETFHIKFEEDSSDHDLKCEVWCAKMKKMVGHVVIPLKGHYDTPYNMAHEHWYPLQIQKATGKKGKVSEEKTPGAAKIGIKMGYVPRIDMKTNKFMNSNKSNDIADIILESEALIKEDNDAMTRIQRTADACTELGIGVVNKINVQDQKIKHSHALVDQINDDLGEAKRELRSIHSIKGQMMNSMTSSKYEHDVKKFTPHESNKVYTTSSRSTQSFFPYEHDVKKFTPHESNKVYSYDTSSHSDQSLFSYNHLSPDTQMEAAELNNKINTAASTVSTLKKIALDMSTALDESNAQLNSLQQETTQTTAKIKKTRQKVRREM